LATCAWAQVGLATGWAAWKMRRPAIGAVVPGPNAPVGEAPQPVAAHGADEPVPAQQEA